MSEPEVTPNDEFVSPTPEEWEILEIRASKQLLIELKTIKKRIYDSKTLINSVLIVQIKGVLKALMRKYNDAGLLLGEQITLRLSDYTKHASIDFLYSQRLRQLIEKAIDQTTESTKEGETVK